MSKPKKLTIVKVRRVSLVKSGANALPVIYKAADNSVVLDIPLKQANENEEGILVGVVYAPGLVDTQGDFTDELNIRKGAYTFMQEGANLDMVHNGVDISKSSAYVAESFIIQKTDTRFNPWKDRHGKDVDVTGGWGIVIDLQDESLRKLYRSGEFTGISMEALVSKAETEDTDKNMLSRLVDAITGLFQPKEVEVEMTAKELADALTAANAPVLSAITELAKVIKEDREIKKADKEDKYDLSTKHGLRRLLNKKKAEEMAEAIEDMSSDELEEYIEGLNGKRKSSELDSPVAHLMTQKADTPHNKGKMDTVSANAALYSMGILGDEESK